MKSKVIETIRSNGMFGQGDRVLAAVSGGADSVALLHVLVELRRDWGITLEALHLNHRLRGAESDRDEAYVRELCAGWNVPLTAEWEDVAAIARLSGDSLEVAGRNCRYSFFARQAKAKQARVATAHTRSDSAETVLLNMVRGTSLRGLGGIPPVRDVFVRPLIDCTRAEIERYCARHGLQFVTDSTNQSDDYTRNRIRRHVLPLLEAENPRFLERQAQMTRMLRADADYLDAQTFTALDSLALVDGSLDRKAFMALPEVLQGRVLVELLRARGVEASGSLVEALVAMIRRGTGKRQLSGAVMFRSGRAGFCLEQVCPNQPFFSVHLPLERVRLGLTVEVFYGKQVTVRLLDGQKFKKTQNFQKKVLNYCLDYDRIDKIVTLRQKLPGDKLRLPGRGCAKTLKNLFQEAGVEPARRLCRVVLADGEKAVWVEGIGPDESVAVQKETKRFLLIEITEGAHDRRYFKNTH